MIQNLKTVDLGLPSGTLWAKCNIGAEKETDCGKYFQWGDIVGRTSNKVKAHSTWETVPFNNGSKDFDLTYFNEHKDEFINEDGLLKNEFDAAYQATDGKFITPSVNDFKELLEHTNFEFVDNGYRFISKKEPKNYLFISEDVRFLWLKNIGIFSKSLGSCVRLTNSMVFLLMQLLIDATLIISVESSTIRL